MKLREDYRLVQVGGEPYLMPFGQAAANLQRGVRLNKSGLLLWNALREGETKEGLLARLAAEYQAEEGEISVLEEDLNRFLCQLAAWGILIPEERKAVPFGAETVRRLTIGGILLEYRGPAELFAPEFEPFCVDDGAAADAEGPDREGFKEEGGESLAGGTKSRVESLAGGSGNGKCAGEEGFRQADLRIRVSREGGFHAQPGQVLVRTSELMIMDTGQDFVCIYPKQSGLTEWHLAKDGGEAVLYCREPFLGDTAQEVFHAVRMIYLVPAQKRGLSALHSASVLYRGRAWLFSGHSGAGKSTHAALWREQYGVPLLNGDLNLLEAGAEGVVVHGMPWCGTSGISTAGSHPLGGIVFVRRGISNGAVRLEGTQGELAVLQHLISPVWTEEMFRENLEFSRGLAVQIPLYRLLCTKDPSAAAVMKAVIDQVIDQL